MRTTVRINKKTAQATFDVEDGQGTECQTGNAHYYDRLRHEFGLPDSSVTETVKPEMNTEAQDQTEHE